MRLHIIFRERAKTTVERLANQPPVSIEQARMQVLW